MRMFFKNFNFKSAINHLPQFKTSRDFFYLQSVNYTGINCCDSRMINYYKAVESRLQTLAGCKLDNFFDVRMTA